MKHNFSQHFTWACKVVSHTDGRTQIYGLWQQGRNNRLQKLRSKKPQVLKTILIRSGRRR